MRTIPASWFRPAPAVYWVDLVASAAIGWAAFAAAVRSPIAQRIALLAVATLALYRAVLFIHEITHRAAREVPLFRLGWNVLVGIPLLLPSFLYENVHTDHHRPRSYGTPADPEYVPFARRSTAFIVGSVVTAAAAPFVFFLRFAVLAPLGWLLPPVRRVVRERCSALMINPAYVRRAPLDTAAVVQEVAACAFAWTVFGLWMAGRVPVAVIGCWMCATAAASTVNAVRTLAAHRYEHESDQLSMLEQLLDSYTIATQPTAVAVVVDAGHAIVAPVGLRFHALHHWIPSLPYHRLGRVHRHLLAKLRLDAPYRSTVAPGFVPIIRTLLRRSRLES